MRTFTIIYVFFVVFFLEGCQKKSETVTNKEDYNQFLLDKENEKQLFINEEILFWQRKFDEAPNQFSYLNKIAGYNSQLFEQTGNIDYLYEAENLLLQSNKAFNYTDPGSIRALARNYITQHRFKEALQLAEKALKIDDGIETQKLLFDVQMELGNYAEAKKNLDELASLKDFDFLIRIAKWNDHLGDLSTAIAMMEKAIHQAEMNENKALMTWSYSNLGDMYGHAGRIQESYDYYLKTLKIDPTNSFALKGLAWIAFSHEKNTKEALRIINHTSKKHNSPDFYLLKAEIAEYDKNETLKEENLQVYFKMLKQSNYGVMYNKYNALLYADDKKMVEKSLSIALQEVENRPTPDSYDLLAWAYFNLGNEKKALEITQKHVANKSFEPELNYHVATIYKAANLVSKVEPIKKDLQSSIYELGPNMISKIENL